MPVTVEAMVTSTVNNSMSSGDDEEQPLADNNILEEVSSLRKQMDDMKEEMKEYKARSDDQHGNSLSDKLKRSSSRRSSCQEFSLDEDTYSLMMTSTPFSIPWTIGFLTAVIFQLGLGVLIGLQLLQHYTMNDCGGVLENDEKNICVPLDVPLTSNLYVAAAQVITIVLVLATQNDLLSSLQTLAVLRNRENVPWDKLIGQEGKRNWCLWLTRIFLPNILKIAQSIAILFASFIIIVQSTDIIELLKDFSALLAVSESDNIMFYLVDMGFLGNYLASRTAFVKKQCIEIPESDCSAGRCKINALALRPILLLIMVVGIVGGWWYVVAGQWSGQFLRLEYPNCTLKGFVLHEFADGHCNNYPPFNTADCGFDGGDCPES